MVSKASMQDGLQQVIRCSSRKAALLIAVCLLGFLAYRLCHLWGRPVRVAPQPASVQPGVPHRNLAAAPTPSLSDPTDSDSPNRWELDPFVQDILRLDRGPENVSASADSEKGGESFAWSSSEEESAEENAVERGGEEEEREEVEREREEETEREEELEESVRSAENVTFVPRGVWKRRLPQAVIIGAKKAGTRALLSFLQMHPQVAVSTKEVHFFDKKYDRGIDWYRKAMPFSYANQVTMEKTPGYLVTPKAPGRLYRMSPNVKLLLLLREPVERALSDYAQSVSKGKRGPFEDKALLSERPCRVDANWSAVRIGLYDRHLDNWFHFFPRSQFLFIGAESMVAHPGREMVRVQDFLGLPRVITERSFYFNASKGFSCVRGTGTGEDGDEDHCLRDGKGRPHQPLSPSIRECLANFYRPHNERLYQMTGIDFHWDDDRLDDKSAGT